MPPKPPLPLKKAKLYSSRTIRSEASDPALSNGVLNLPNFIAAREYEIRAFEQSQLNTKYASLTRIFQNLPRTMRRRTASHNVKRIPKRLRARALKEMQNSTTGVPPKRPHLRGRDLHRLKMRKKLLRLASKIKELRGIPSVLGPSFKEQFKTLNLQMETLKRAQALKTVLGDPQPTNNALAAHDRVGNNGLCPKPKGNLKFAHRQKDFTWLPNHIWHAKRFHLIKRWGYQIPFSPNQKCFRATSRASKELLLAFETSYYGELIVETTELSKMVSFLNEFTKYPAQIPEWFIKGRLSYNDWIYNGSDKVSFGTMYLSSQRTCQLLVRLHPSNYEEVFRIMQGFTDKDELLSITDCRYALGSIQLRGPTSLNVVSKIMHLQAEQNITSAWWQYSQHKDAGTIPNGTTFAFFIQDPRFWKHPATPPRNKHPQCAMSVNDLVLLPETHLDERALSAILSLQGRHESYRNMYTLKQLGREFARYEPQSTHIHGKIEFPVLIQKTAECTWCVTMPWFWVQPFWSKLMQVNGVKAAGMRQDHQLNFEAGRPTYPHDYPFLAEGYRENRLVAQGLKIKRDKLPASKRQPLERMESPLDIAADWYFLRKWTFGKAFVKDATSPKCYFGEFDETRSRVLRNLDDLATVINETRPQDLERIPIAEFSAKNAQHQSIADGSFKPDALRFPALPVVLVRISITNKGTIADNARIYERANPQSVEHLIGFVTSGAFNISQGRATGLGHIIASHRDIRKAYIRNVGCTTMAPANIEVERT